MTSAIEHFQGAGGARGSADVDGAAAAEGTGSGAQGAGNGGTESANDADVMGQDAGAGGRERDEPGAGDQEEDEPKEDEPVAGEPEEDEPERDEPGEEEPEVEGAEGDRDEEGDGDAEYAEAGDGESAGRGAKRRKLDRGASCTCTGVSQATLQRLRAKTHRAAGMETDEARVETLKELRYGTGGLAKMCYLHLKMAASHCGFRVRELKSAMLVDHLELYWDNRDNLVGLRAAPDHYTKFKMADRLPVPADALGIFKYHLRPNTLDVAALPPGRAEAIFQECSGEASSWSRWHGEGNLIVPGLFTWLWEGARDGEGGWEGGVGELMDQEFLMYEHHQGTINGKANHGWLRNMFYGVTQQVMRQDLGHWMLYVAARPDGRHQLISYPYYAKFVQATDSGTAFRHIDLNIEQFCATGRGGSAIQGSVSLDDESAEAGCTELVPGIHRRLGEWWAGVKLRAEAEGESLGEGALVQDVRDLWRREDVAKFGGWVPVPCPRGGVRITHPATLHGSMESSGRGVRRTILPWYVAVAEDGSTLDVEESDTYEQVGFAHLTHTATAVTASGFPNHYGRPGDRFGPATSVIAPTPVGRALVCQQSWRDPAVARQANLLLGPDREAAWELIWRSRVALLRLFKEAYREQRRAEMEGFQEDSFYYQQELEDWQEKADGELDSSGGE